MVVVEGLAFGIFFEERLLQAREQALVVDIGAGIMDEDARFDVAIGFDMAVIAAASDTAVDELAIVLEIDGENRLAPPLRCGFRGPGVPYRPAVLLSVAGPTRRRCRRAYNGSTT